LLIDDPFAGTWHDNIFKAGGPEITAPGRKQAKILASPSDPTDSILLPTDADVGQTMRPPSKPIAAAGEAKLLQDVQGTYAVRLKQHLAVLTIDGRTITIVVGAAMYRDLAPHQRGTSGRV
jgi:hypothetical protein